MQLALQSASEHQFLCHTHLFSLLCDAISNSFSSLSIPVAPALTHVSSEVYDSFQGPDLVIHEPEEVLASMNDWCQIHHKQSGMRQNQSPLSHPKSCREHKYTCTCIHVYTCTCTPKHTLMLHTFTHVCLHVHTHGCMNSGISVAGPFTCSHD